MTSLKVHKDAADFYFEGDEQFPRQPNEGSAYMDDYIGVSVTRAMFTRPNGSTDMRSWSKWKDNLNL